MDRYSFDLQRILIGDLPWLFFVEIALRTTILFLYTMTIMRFLGKRSAGQLTPMDVVVIVALGSAVGDPMFYPEVPLLYGVVVITIVVGLQRLGLYWATNHVGVDQLLKGNASLVVVDGVLDLEGLDHANVSKREIFQMARQRGYRHLGEIHRMYIETDDYPSIFGFDRDEIRPGLPFEPPWEMSSPATSTTGSAVGEDAIAACINCGQTARFKPGDRLTPCPRCHHSEWVLVK